MLPLKNNILIELIEKDKVTKSGIILSRGDGANFAYALVIGPTVQDVYPADKLLVDWNKAKVVSSVDKTFLISEKDVIAVLEDE